MNFRHFKQTDVPVGKGVCGLWSVDVSRPTEAVDRPIYHASDAMMQ